MDKDAYWRDGARQLNRVLHNLGTLGKEWENLESPALQARLAGLEMEMLPDLNNAAELVDIATTLASTSEPEFNGFHMMLLEMQIEQADR